LHACNGSRKDLAFYLLFESFVPCIERLGDWRVRNHKAIPAVCVSQCLFILKY